MGNFYLGDSTSQKQQKQAKILQRKMFVAQVVQLVAISLSLNLKESCCNDHGESVVAHYKKLEIESDASTLIID